jgi:multidrug transporter EmrE-like cation transporter
MSLRAFHIVFVTVSTLLFAFLAVWAFALATDRTTAITALGVAGAAGTLVMPLYGVFFYRKVRKIVI